MEFYFPGLIAETIYRNIRISSLPVFVLILRDCVLYFTHTHTQVRGLVLRVGQNMLRMHEQMTYTDRLTEITPHMRAYF